MQLFKQLLELKDFYNQATKQVKEVKPEEPKVSESLAEEAKKYKSAEEFIKAQKGTTKLTIKELKNRNIEDFVDGDLILVDDKYLIKVKYGKYPHPSLETTVSKDMVDLSSTAGVRGGRPYFIDDFISTRSGKTTKQSQLTDIYNQATKGVKPTISKALEPLAQEAKKYKSAEEFSKAWSIDGMRGRYWHITDDINFKPKKGYAPSGAIGQPGKLVSETDPTAGLIISSDPKNWLPFARTRKYMAEIDLSKAKPNVDYNIVNRGFGQEIFVKNLDKVSVKSVKPINQAMADVENWKKIGFDSKDEAIKFYNQATKEVKAVVKAEVKPVAKPVVKPKGKPSKVALSIEAKAVEKGITEQFKGLAEYEPVVIKEQIAKVDKLMKEDIERAKRMATGKEPLSDGIKGAMLIKMMEDYAMEQRDGDLILALANSPLVSETSEAGQTLRLTRERSPDSATARIQEIKKARKDVAKKKRRGKTDKQIKDKMKKDLEEKISKNNKKISKNSWEAFVEEITC